MNALPLRLPPGSDLRQALEDAAHGQDNASAFVLSGIGSLTEAQIRFAGASSATRVPGPLEIISVSGSVTPAGAHLHVSVSTQDGRVLGGHLAYGSTVRTTAEVLLALLPGWSLTREHDAVTGYKELTARKKS
jgi:uncharacterized protein